MLTSNSPNENDRLQILLDVIRHNGIRLRDDALQGMGPPAVDLGAIRHNGIRLRDDALQGEVLPAVDLDAIRHLGYALQGEDLPAVDLGAVRQRDDALEFLKKPEPETRHWCQLL